MEPDSLEAVTIALPPKTQCNQSGALCTSDGRVVSSALMVRVMGPPTISISNATVNENSNSPIRFTVTLNRISSQPVTVDWATADGSAQAGSDYTSAFGTLAFATGETSKTIDISLVNDSIDEGVETFSINLSNASGAHIADGEGTGTIQNSDPIPKDWIARMGEKVRTQAVNAIEERVLGNRVAESLVAQNQSDEELGHSAAFNGKESVFSQNDFHSRERFFQDDEKVDSLQELGLEYFAGRTFNLGSGEEVNKNGKGWSVWGRVEMGHFNSLKETQEISGEVTTAFIGADVTLGEREDWLMGLALSRTEANGHSNSRSTHDEVKLKGQLNSIYPYVRYRVNEATDVWGMLGAGRGTLEINDGKSYETDLEMAMGAVGARRELWQHDNGAVVALKTDVSWLRMESTTVVGEAGRLEGAKAEVSRARLMAEAKRKITFDNGAILTPTVEMGIRHDRGDAQTGSGIEVGMGARYTTPNGRWFFEGKGSRLLTSEGDEEDDWGMSLAMSLTPERNGHGLSFRIEPSWGTQENGTQRLWSMQDARNLAVGQPTSKEIGQLRTEISYGLAPDLFGRVVTPYLGMNIGDREVMRTGVWWPTGTSGRMSLEAQHMSDMGEESGDSALMIYQNMQW